VKETMDTLRKLPASNWFCEYRSDVDRLEAN
jgi:hypothetical protein